MFGILLYENATRLLNPTAALVNVGLHFVAAAVFLFCNLKIELAMLVVNNKIPNKLVVMLSYRRRYRMYRDALCQIGYNPLFFVFRQ